MLSLAAPAAQASPSRGVRCLSVPLSVSRLTAPAVAGRLGRPCAPWLPIALRFSGPLHRVIPGLRLQVCSGDKLNHQNMMPSSSQDACPSAHCRVRARRLAVPETDSDLQGVEDSDSEGWPDSELSPGRFNSLVQDRASSDAKSRTGLTVTARQSRPGVRSHPGRRRGRDGHVRPPSGVSVAPAWPAGPRPP